MKPIKITAEFIITPEDYERHYKEMTQSWNERNIRNYGGRKEDIEVPPLSLKKYHDFIECVICWKFGVHASWRKLKNTTTMFPGGTNISNLKITCCEET